MIHSCLVWFLWWLRHGAIGPIEATPVGVNVDWPDFWIYAFELVIRLGKVQQMALLFCTFCDVPLIRLSLEILWTSFSTAWCRSEHSETFFFSQLLLTIHDNSIWYRNQAGTRLSGVAFFLLMVVWWGETYCAPNSLELESRFMPLWLTWTRAWIGTTHDL